MHIHDAEIPELAGIREVDQRLVVLAKHLGGKVVTNDYNLNKIAHLQGVEVINLNDLANAMKPIVLPGESLTVKLLKRARSKGKGSATWTTARWSSPSRVPITWAKHCS